MIKTLFAVLALASLAVAQPATATADDSFESPAAAARRSREAKTANAKKIYTDDDLPTSGTGVNVVGPSFASRSSDYSSPSDPVQEQKAIDSQWRNVITQQKARIAELQRQLDDAQRSEARAAHFYAANPNPRYARYKQQVESLTEQIEDAKHQLVDLQEQAHKAGANKAYD
jgi:hypothetical protein